MRPRIRTLVASVAAVVLLTAVTVSAVLAHGGFGRGGGKSNVTTAIEEQTGLSQEDLRARLADGESLADIIEAEGGDLEAVVTAALTAFDEKIEALASRGAGDPHPFVIGEEATQNMFEMIQHCAQAGLARLAR